MASDSKLKDFLLVKKLSVKLATQLVPKASLVLLVWSISALESAKRETYLIRVILPYREGGNSSIFLGLGPVEDILVVFFWF